MTGITPGGWPYVTAEDHPIDFPAHSQQLAELLDSRAQAGGWMTGHNPQGAANGIVSWKAGGVWGDGATVNTGAGELAVPAGVWAIHWMLNGAPTTTLRYWNGSAWTPVASAVNSSNGFAVVTAAALMTFAIVFESGTGLISDGTGSTFAAYKIG